MSAELAEFHEIYFAECFENIDLMQVGLAQYSAANAHGDALNRAYRAAHSIKGASGIFGFHAVADSAQALEIMLDQIRQRKRELNPELEELLQQSIERLHCKLESVRVEFALDMGRINEQREILRREQEVYAFGASSPRVEGIDPAA